MNSFKTYIYLLIIPFILATASARADNGWEWESVSPMNFGRMGHCSVLLRDSIYVFGGTTIHRHMEVTRTAEVYDPAHDSWTEIEPLPIPLYQASAVTNGRLIFILGGTTVEGGPNSEIYVFDPRNRRNPYIRLGSLPFHRWAMGSIPVGRRILAIGGISGRLEYRRDGYWWEPDSNRWVESPRLNHPSAGFGIAYNGAVWVVGGMSFGPMNRVEVLRRDEWEIVPRRGNLPEPRGELGLAFLGDTLLIAAGGLGQARVASEVFATRVDTINWFDLPPMIEARAEFSLLTYRNRVYAIGGGMGGQNHLGEILNSVEVLQSSTGVETGGEQTSPSYFSMDFWPNPTNRTVSFRLPGWRGRLQLVDPTGRMVLERNITEFEQIATEDVTHLPTGRYQILFFDAGGFARPAGGLIILK